MDTYIQRLTNKIFFDEGLTANGIYYIMLGIAILIAFGKKVILKLVNRKM